MCKATTSGETIGDPFFMELSIVRWADINQITTKCNIANSKN